MTTKHTINQPMNTKCRLFYNLPYFRKVHFYQPTYNPYAPFCLSKQRNFQYRKTLPYNLLRRNIILNCVTQCTQRIIMQTADDFETNKKQAERTQKKYRHASKIHSQHNSPHKIQHICLTGREHFWTTPIKEISTTFHNTFFLATRRVNFCVVLLSWPGNERQTQSMVCAQTENTNLKVFKLNSVQRLYAHNGIWILCLCIWRVQKHACR